MTPPHQRGELTAAAARFTTRFLKNRTTGPNSSWQNTAWDMYDQVPEVRFAASWVGNAMSGARLYAGRRTDDGTVEAAPDDHISTQLVSSIAGGVDGQAALLRDFGPHLVVPGEGWIIIRPTENDGEDWRVLSIAEVKQQGTALVAEIDGEQVTIPAADPADPPDDQAPIAIRVWQPHPRRQLEADSPVRSSLTVLSELQLLNAAVAAIARSRLTGRGVLLVPKGARFPTPPGSEDDAEDDFLEVLMTVAETAYKEPESAAATVPIILEVPSEVISDTKLITFESNFDELALKLRDEAVRRFAQGLEIPAEILLGLGDVNHWCTVPSVQIMTQEGWKTHDQLVPGELVLTLNHETGLSEWQPLQAVNTWDVVDEPMVRIKGKRHSSVTTAAHRWPILTGRAESRGRAWTTSGELLADRTRPDAPANRLDHLVLAAPHADLPTEPKYSDALVEVVAWYFTEGTTGRRPGRNAAKLIIHQSHVINPDNCARIERALTNLFGPVSETLDKAGRYSTPESVERRAKARQLRAANPKMSYAAIGEQLGVSAQMVMKYLRQDAKTADTVPRWRKSVGSNRDMTIFRLNGAAADVILEHAPDRMVSLDFIRSLTQSQLELFIDTAVRGDGWHSGNTPILTQKDPAMLDAFELAIILSGRSPLRRKQTAEGRSANGPRMKTQTLASSSDRTTFAPQAKHLSEERYTGTIWCPTTPNGTWLARHEGSVFYTGNSVWALSQEAIRLGIAPRLAAVAHALTTQWLRPLLQAEGLPDADQWLVWYDTAPLRVQSNRPQVALEVFDRGAISADALRRETGFDDSDAPNAAEANANARQPSGDLPVSEAPREPDTLPASAAQATASRAGLLAAADGIIWAALASAGEKIVRTPACPRSERAKAKASPGAVHTLVRVDPHQVEQWKLLDGAWTRVPEVASRYGVDSSCLTAALDTYTRELITAGVPHEFDLVPGALGLCADLAAAA